MLETNVTSPYDDIALGHALLSSAFQGNFGTFDTIGLYKLFTFNDVMPKRQVPSFDWGKSWH